MVKASLQLFFFFFFGHRTESLLPKYKIENNLHVTPKASFGPSEPLIFDRSL